MFPILILPNGDKFHTHLIFEILNGDFRKYEILIRKYEKFVSGIVARRVKPYKTTEVVHEVFVRAFFSLRTFKGIQSFEHWLAKIAIRTCADFWRDYYRMKETPVSELSDSAKTWLETVVSTESEINPEIEASKQEAKEVLNWALAQLSAEDREIISLMYFENRSIAEVADLLDMTESNVKVHAFRARQKLREKISAKLNLENV